MNDIYNTLINLPLLRNIRPEPIQATIGMWERRAVPAGQMLWSQRSSGDNLAILIAGELVAMVDDQEVGRVLPGELLGEAGAFLPGSRRITSLLAWTDIEVVVIGAENLQRLRERGHPVYDALLSEAISHLARRVRTIDQEIAKLSKGSMDAPERIEVSALIRLWRSLVPGGPEGPCPPIQPLLQKRATLRDAPFDLVRQISRAFIPVAFAQGAVVVLEGEQGGAAYLVASGEVEVLRHVRSQKATRLALLRAGDLFGVNTLITRGARTASCVAATPAWIYRIESDAVDALPADAKRMWQESMLASLAAQLRNANDLLQRVRPLRVSFADGSEEADGESLDMLVEPLTADEPMPEPETLETAEIEPVEHLSEDEIRRIMTLHEDDTLIPPEDTPAGSDADEDRFEPPPELRPEGSPDSGSADSGSADSASADSGSADSTSADSGSPGDRTD